MNPTVVGKCVGVYSNGCYDFQFMGHTTKQTCRLQIDLDLDINESVRLILNKLFHIKCYCKDDNGVLVIGITSFSRDPCLFF